MITPAKKSVTAFAPATISNLGPGFDILGFPLIDLGDTVKVSVNSNAAVSITKITGTDRLPFEVSKNTAGIAVSNFLTRIGADFGVDIELTKGLPLGSGLGSSAASSVAAVFAVNNLLKNPFDKTELLEFALDGEEAAAGSRHGDNVIPSLFGGLILIHDTQNHKFINLPYPDNLICLVVHPSVEINTAFARSILDSSVPLKSVVEQTGKLAKLIYGMSVKNIDMLRGVFEDQIAEPKRSRLIPEYNHIKQIASDCGAVGCNISGSGPSVFSLFDDRQKAALALEAMVAVYKGKGIAATGHISAINTKGAEVLRWE